jgi:hypothetical protein
MNTLQRIFLAATFAFATAACGRPFDVKTPNGFFELQDQSDEGYAYRSTSAEGVVLAVRVVDDDGRGSLSFWEKAITQKIRDERGYALLAAADVKAADGTPGRSLRFAHDESGKPFDYWLTVFVGKKRLFIVEAGGDRPAFEKEKATIEAAITTFKLD